MSRRIEVVSYDPEWLSKYETEAKLVAEVLKEEFVRIHHIGSTSVPGLRAKPVIDLMVEVKDIEEVDACNPAMEELGYCPRGELDIPGRRYYSKEINGLRTYHVHCYPLGHPEIERHLKFRDYLKAHPDKALEYGDLKDRIVEQYRYDSHGYTEAKSDFILDVDRLVLEWKDGKNEQQR